MAESILEFSAWVGGAGALGVLAFMATYVAATVLFVPASLLSLAAGFVWGPALGALVVWPAAMLGATAAFVFGRTALRARIERRLHRWPRVVAFDRAVGDNGLLIVFLLRLSPVVPFVAMNYGMALTRLSVRDFLVGTGVGIVPGMFAYVYAGSAVTEIAALAGGGVTDTAAGRALFWGGLAATAVFTIVIARIAKQSLSRHLEQA